MSFPYRTYPWALRETFGNFAYKNIYSTSFGYTTHSKKIAAGTSTAILAATNGATTVQTITAGITQPDVPRALIVTPGGTTAQILDSVVTINGTNVEGKPISEIFRFANGTSLATSGVKAFAQITSVVIGQQAGAACTFAVGTLNVIGLNHRLFKNNTTVKVYTATAVYGALTLQNAPTVVANEQNIENNTVLPATIPNGSLIFNVFYQFDDWRVGEPINDQPEYSTTTSTSSTSSSTSSTTITTSTSSTSTSFSSTSTSSTSTSISTSSTSTSTTTAP